MSDSISNAYIDEFQQLSDFDSSGTALLYTEAASQDDNLTLTAISVDGVHFVDVDAASNPQSGVPGTSLTGTNSYLSFYVTADGSIEITPVPGAQTLVDEVNANAVTSSTPLNDILYYQVFDSSTGLTLTNEVTFDVNDVGFTSPPGSLIVGADATAAVPGISLAQSTSDDGSGYDNPVLAVTLSTDTGEGSFAITGSLSGDSTVDSENGYIIIQGNQSDINIDLTNLTYTAGDNGGDNSALLMTVTDGPAQTGDYFIGNFITPSNNTYDSEIASNSAGTGGALDGTKAAGESNVSVIAISADGMIWTDVPTDGSAVSVNGTYETFSSDDAGDGSNGIPNAQADINAINQNNLNGDAPLTDTFYYKVEDGAGNVAVDQFTFTYGDVAADIPSTLSSGPIDVAAGSTISLSGITVDKAVSTDGNEIAANPSVAITLDLYDFNGQPVDGTLSVQNGTGVTVTYDTNSVTISGLQNAVNADLQTLTYTAGNAGGGVDTLGVTTTDDSYVSGYTYQSATYDEAGFQSVACFLAGTMIEANGSEVSVETIRAGDFVTVIENGRKRLRPVKWVGYRSVRSAELKSDEAHPVRIKAHAFADGIPHRDLLVTPEHCIFVAGGLIPARMLVNGRTIRVDHSITNFIYYHLELEQHGIVLAEGLPSESYLDTGNRGNFANAGMIALQPNFSMKSCLEAKYAAPLTVDRARVEPIWQRLVKRAGQLGAISTEPVPSLTADPALHLTTDTGLCLGPISCKNERYIFMVPRGTTGLRLRSRSARPSDTTGPFIDDRRVLGVLVGAVIVHQGRCKQTIETHLADADLSGWHDREDSTSRWTNGDALLTLGVDFSRNASIVEIQILHAGPYISETVVGLTAAA